MKSLFNSTLRITQKFGVNSSYYGKFGLIGHEGLDCVPTGPDWTVISLTNGVIVKDEDNPRNSPYGVNLTVWDKENNRAFQYCHLEKNNFSLGDEIRVGYHLGKMGSTGNSTGPHVHLNMFKTDSNGIRLNRDNGYLGGIDPLPFLEEKEEMTNTILVDKDDFERLVTKGSSFDETLKALDLPLDSSGDTVLRSLSATKGLIGTLQREKAELEQEVKNKVDQLARDRALCQVETNCLGEAIKESNKKYEHVTGDYNTLKGEYMAVRKELGNAQKDLAVCRSGSPKPQGIIAKLIYVFT